MIFNYDPTFSRAELSSQGYVHLKDVLSEDFLTKLQKFYEDSMREGENESADWKVAGKKRQFIFEFESSVAAEEFRLGLAGLTGIPEKLLTISERHLKVYDDQAKPYPAPHKDRSASHFSIGLPIHVPHGSSVCVFPDLDCEKNQEDHAIFLTDRDRNDLEGLYDNDKALLLNEKPGDLVVFLGSALWHERVRGAGTAVLYIKINGEGIDPLGENIYAA